MFKLSFPRTCLNSVAFSHDGSTLATGGTNGGVRIWRLQPVELKHELNYPRRFMIRDLAFTPTGSLIVRGEGTVHNLTLDPVPLWQPIDVGGESVSVMVVSRDGSRLIVAGQHSLRVLDLQGHTIWSHRLKATASALACTPDASTVVVGQEDGTIWVAQEDKIELCPTPGRTIEVKALAVAPDASAIAVGAKQHLRLYHRLPSFREVMHTTLGRTHFLGVAWHPTGTFFTTANGDGTVDSWDAGTGERRESLAWKVGKLHDVVFDFNGDRAACCSLRGRVVVWDVDL